MYNPRRDDLQNPPRLGICGKYSKDPLSCGVPVGDWYLAWGAAPGFDAMKIEPIGTRIQVQGISMSFKAINFDEGYISRDPSSDAYQRVRRMDEVPPRGMEGTETLVYLPQLNVFAVYFATSRYQRRFVQGNWYVDPPVRGAADYMTKAALWESRLLKTERHEWYGPALGAVSKRTYRPPGKLLAVERFHSRPMFELFNIQASPIAKRLYAQVESVANELRQLGYDEASVLTVGINALEKTRRPLV